MSMLSTLNIIWTDTMPHFCPKESPSFRYNNALWSLKLSFKRCGVYTLNLECKSDKQEAETFGADVYFKMPTSKNFKYALAIHNSYCNEDVSLTADSYGRFTLLCVSKSSDFQYSPNGFSLINSRLYGKRKRTSSETISDACLPFSLDSLSGDLSNLLDQKVLPDVEFRVGDQTFPAHRAVLAARSEVFAAMFKQEMAESQSGVVDFEDLEPSVFDVFLKYMYTGRISEESMTEDVISKLYVASDKYAVSSLKLICIEYMMNRITGINYLSYLTLADRLHDQEFKTAVVSFLVRNEALIKSDAFKAFGKEHLLLANEVYAEYIEKKTN